VQPVVYTNWGQLHVVLRSPWMYHDACGGIMNHVLAGGALHPTPRSTANSFLLTTIIYYYFPLL
jgi:hypothetical protein